MNRPITETLRAALARVEKIPAHIPDPRLSISAGHVHADWHDVDETLARTIVEALPGDWSASESYLYRYDANDVLGMCFIYLARAKPVPVVNPADLLTPVAS